MLVMYVTYVYIHSIKEIQRALMLVSIYLCKRKDIKYIDVLGKNFMAEHKRCSAVKIVKLK